MREHRTRREPVRWQLCARICVALTFVILAAIEMAGSVYRPAYAASNPIVGENQQPGTGEWQIPNSKGQAVADDVNNQIKGYASLPSVNKGSNITFFVTVNPSQTFSLDIYRMGYYQGLGGRLMASVGPISGISQSACPVVDSATRLVACNWSPSYTLTVPTTWTDGIYLVVLTNATKYQNYIIFVVRDDGRTASLLYQNSVNTYETYNNWGGYSLYSYNSSGGNRAYKVSFDRPYRADGSGDYFGWEVYFVQWAEQQGFDLTYSTDLDTALNPARLQSVKGVLVVGHDEYWTKAMYDAVQNARDAGVSLGFFGANATYWQARYEASLSGVANRVLVSYKTSDIPNSTDPLTATNPALTTDLWRNPLPNRPEQSLIGVMYTSETGNNWDATVPDVVINSANPTYTGTDFVDGSRVPGIVGYEADRSWTTFALPANQSYALLSNSPYTNVAGASDYSNSVVYQALSGAWVFGAGSMGWSYALARPGYLNLGIQQTTLNVLNRFISNVPVPVTATPTVTPVPTPTALPSAYRDAVVADQPLSYWRLDESGGSSAGDWQHLNNGAYVGAPSLGQPGALAGDPDTAVLFNGTSQYVSVPYNASLNPAAFSVEVWAKPAGGAGTYRGVVASRSYPTGWVLYAGADNTWQFWVNNGTGMLSVPGGPVSLNVWSQLVGTFDGTTARLYVNGVLVSSGTVASYQPQASRPLVVGQSEPGSGFFFPGVVDEPAVYPTALTASQVQHHYLIGAVGVTPTATPTPAPTGTPGATDTPTATGTATASPTIAVTATPTQTPAASATPTPSPSPVVTSTPSITPTLAPPPAPTRLRARAAGTSRRPKVDLSWQSSGAGLTSIAVERSPDQNTWTVIANLPGAAVSYTDATVASQATYFYRIRAINAAGASPYSRPASVTTT